MTLPRESSYGSLARKRREHLIAYLRDTEEKVVQLDDLVEYIHKIEPDSPSPDRESIRIDLYHIHLPFLDEEETIDFDHRSETVQYRSHARLEAELDQLSDTDTETEVDAPQFP
ncbi:DUF7344 domain-containing protein [Halosimplex amylolyticum]|uniref:DUF7344 domain-containing protein n=1 Tax=Halosimplex amylolyticum TaxID=3396616 RepID=UPI003F54FB19